MEGLRAPGFVGFEHGARLRVQIKESADGALWGRELDSVAPKEGYHLGVPIRRTFVFFLFHIGVPLFMRTSR